MSKPSKLMTFLSEKTVNSLEDRPLTRGQTNEFTVESMNTGFWWRGKGFHKIKTKSNETPIKIRNQ